MKIIDRGFVRIKCTRKRKFLLHDINHLIMSFLLFFFSVRDEVRRQGRCLAMYNVILMTRNNYIYKNGMNESVSGFRIFHQEIKSNDRPNIDRHIQPRYNMENEEK